MGKMLGGSPKIELQNTDNSDAEKKAEEERKKALERQRRGLESTIRTSYNGILDTQNHSLNRKNLLGE